MSAKKFLQKYADYSGPHGRRVGGVGGVDGVGGVAIYKKNTQLPVAPVSVHQWELQVVKNFFFFFLA